MATSEEKAKFNFSCTRCGKCCEERGPIPLILEDLYMWAANKVVSNVMPYIRFFKTPYNTLDLVFARDEKNPFTEDAEKAKKKDEKDEKVDLSCPMFNKEKKECSIYQFRPYSCRTYPLEFDGTSFAVVDSECAGVGKGEMTPEARKEMKELAKKMNQQLTLMRTGMPVLGQAMQGFVIKELIEQQKKAFDQMSPEERKKYDEMMEKEGK